MAKILIGYERGHNMGHMRRLAPIARALAGQGHQVVFFLRNFYDMAGTLARDPIAVVPVPDLVAPLPALREPKRMGSYSDIMCYCGFYRFDTLYAGTLAWQTLIDHIRPDLIVCDHSPVLCLAAFGQVPVIQVGSGFTLPPAEGEVFPTFTAKQKPGVDPASVLKVMQDVQRRRGRLAPQALTEPFRTLGRLVCALPELDPYRAQRKDPQIGPTESLPAQIKPPKEPAFFAYLGLEHGATPKILDSLKKSDLPGSAYVRGMNDATARRYVRPGLTLYKEPQPIERVLAPATVVIHHGGMGTSSAALGTGRPSLVAPVHQETSLNGAALVELGAGRILTKEIIDKDPAGAIRTAAADGGMAKAAQKAAKKLHAAGPWRALDRIVERCLEAVEPATV